MEGIGVPKNNFLKLKMYKDFRLPIDRMVNC